MEEVCTLRHFDSLSSVISSPSISRLFDDIFGASGLVSFEDGRSPLF